MQLVSVIMPYYRKKEYVENAIISVENQSYKNLELIIIYDDDNINDFEFLKNITQKYSNIKILKNDHNIGAGLSRNKGIKNANGNLIAFIDADDFWYSEKIEKQIAYLDEKNLDFVFCDYLKKRGAKKKEIICSKEILKYENLLYSCDIGLSTVLIKKNIILNNPFPPLKTKEDFVVWLSIAKKGTNLVKLNETLVEWNSVEGSLSSNIFQKVIDGYRVYRKFQNFSVLVSIYYLIILSFNSLKK
tara:strand:- start:2513 stop:3247 length:735 start_codon:yes stop_codon:yes gene_type:complete